MAAVRIAYFKLYYPAAYYAAVLTRYGNKTNVSNFAYDKAINISSLQEYEAYQKYIKTESTRAEQEKDAIRLALIIYEMRLRGFTVGNATLNSHHRNFAIDPNNPNIIIRPLSSIAGIGEGASVKIYNNIQAEGVGTVDELYDRVVMIDNEDGTFSAKRIFTDSVLIKLGLEVPPDLSEVEKSLCKKFKIATSKFSKTQVRAKLEYFRLNPPYEVTERDKALAKALKLKERDFETTQKFKQEIDQQCLMALNLNDKLGIKIASILNSGD